MIKKRLVKMLEHSKKYIIENIVWQWISLIAQIAVILSITNLIQDVIFTGASKSEMISVLAIIVSAIIIRICSDKMVARASYEASVDVKRILREKIYEKLLRLGVSYREQVSTSEIVQLSTEGVEQLEIYFGRYLPQLFYSLLAPITLFFVLGFLVSWKASLVLLLCVPLIPLSIVFVQKFAKKLLSKYWGIYAGLGDSFLENLQGLTTLKIYKADEAKAKEMDEEAQTFRKITMKVLTMQLNSTSVMDIMAYGGAAVGMIVALYQLSNQEISIAGTLAIILLASEFFIPLRLLGSFFHIAMNGMSASDKIFNLLDLEEPKTGTKTIDTDKVDIIFDKVFFSYDEKREILKDIDLTLDSGKFVSLVGLSGSGKSTIARIITGENKGYKGSIKVGSKELKDLNEKSILKHITLIGNNSYLFKGTIRENLLMGKPSATDKELEDVLEVVNMTEYLREQKRLDTVVLERGDNFSGGQKQRIALARAILHDSPVYIFDEATSNIDSESEDMIMKALHHLAKTKTILLISHRLSNVVGSDKVYMLKNGHIIEEGKHSELMELAGEYKHLFDSQKALENYGKED